MRALSLTLVLIPALALAHGITPQSLSVSVRADAGDDLLVGSTFGGIVSHDRGATWRVICEEAIGYGSGQRPAWWLTDTGATFACSLKGLYVARTDGCDWQTVPDFELQGCSEIRGQGGTLIAAQGKYSTDNDNGILRSTDDGKTWTRAVESSKVLFYSSVRLAPSNPQRVYVAAWWFQPLVSQLLRSDDNGVTFTRVDLSAALPAAGAFYVLGVHPAKSDVVFATVSRSDPANGWLLRSTNGGDSFTPVITTPVIFNSLAFGADPSTVYAAAGNELYKSTDEGVTFSLLPVPQKNACVATFDQHVYSCGLQELDGFVVGEGTGQGFSPLLRWSSIAGPISCPAGSAVNTLCEPLWPVVQASFPIDLSDAGTLDGGQGDGGTDPPLKPKGCGCSTVEGPLALAALLIVRRPRRAC